MRQKVKEKISFQLAFFLDTGTFFDRDQGVDRYLFTLTIMFLTICVMAITYVKTRPKQVSQVQDGTSQKLTMTQSKLTEDGSPPKEDYLGLVPIVASTQSAPDKAQVLGLLETKTEEFVITDVSERDCAESTTESFVTEEKAKEIEAFFKENRVPIAERTVQQCIENIKLYAKWLQRELNAVQEFLSSSA